MEFMGRKLEDIIVTLPYEDGTCLECGVYSYFEVNDKKYFTLSFIFEKTAKVSAKIKQIVIEVNNLKIVLNNIL